MTPIEKAARALAGAFQHAGIPAGILSDGRLAFAQGETIALADAAQLVSAVLQAIREPNREMVEAAMAVVDDPNDGGFHGLVFESQFTAAIDAALSE